CRRGRVCTASAPCRAGPGAFFDLSRSRASDVVGKRRVMTAIGGPPSGQPGVPPAGSIFQGGYEILAELGTGSFGRVYKARQLSTGQADAIKILRFWGDDTRADVTNQSERFRREMRLRVGLPHPNIA